MNTTSYKIISFPTTRFAFLKEKVDKYSLIFLGENLSKEEVEEKLKEFDTARNIETLSRFFDRVRIKAVGILKTKDLSDFKNELQLIRKKIDFAKSFFAILVAYKSVHKKQYKYSLPEEAFLISSAEFIQNYEEDISTGFCYDFILKVLDEKKRVAQILVHQMKHPNPIIPNRSSHPTSTEVVMPHMGNLDDLKSALYYLKQQKTTPAKISVCFDEAVNDNHFELADEYSGNRFFVNFPARVGPYLSRDILSRGSEEDVIIFHDSDDISTVDRVAVLTETMKNENLDVVGSHELRIDKINKVVETIRFPSVNPDLKKEQIHHSIFFPTTAIKQSAYVKIGGLSTIRRHSSDTQFYLRARFFLNLRTVDEFLYIRVKHEDSLTSLPATAKGSPFRARLGEQWRNDYFRIRNRDISLQNSTLIDEYNPIDANVISLEKENRPIILEWQNLNQKIKARNNFRHLTKPKLPDENEMPKGKLKGFSAATDPAIDILKQSISWKIGWRITRIIIFLFGRIPFVKKGFLK